MYQHQLRVYASKAHLKKESQLAWKFAQIAGERVPLESDVSEMIINRLIDNAAVATAAICANFQASCDSFFKCALDA